MAGIDFTGQVAVVTGAGGALGSAFCRELARRGAAIVANDLGGSPTGEGQSFDYADAVVRDIEAAGGRAVANYDSVATEAGGQAIIDAALSSFGRVDVVVSNAGNQRNGRFGELSEDDIESVYAVHTKGAFFVCQPAYRAMVEQGYGRIVLVSSQSGIFGNPFRSNYGSAKTALIGLMNVIAQEAPPGVAVNCLFPNAQGGRLGGTPLSERPDIEFLKAAGEKTSHFREGMQPDFIVPLACYLASGACANSQNMYSALGGKYSRIFVGLTEGWYKPGPVAPTCEELAKQIARIDDRPHYDVPLSGLDDDRRARPPEAWLTRVVARSCNVQASAPNVGDVESPGTRSSADAIVALTRTHPDCFVGASGDLNHLGTVFGGRLVAQALAAATRTVANMPATSLHAYFLAPARTSLPFDIRVDRLRDSRRFANRQVTIHQEGVRVFVLACQFHAPEQGFEHQAAAMPEVPPPEDVPTLQQFVRAHREELDISAIHNFSGELPVEMRPLNPESYFFGRPERPERDFWFRLPSAAAVTDPRLQHCLLAYASDYWLAGVAASTHAFPTNGERLLISSLDHALWLHRPVRCQECLMRGTEEG